ncbi:hypothetical protein ALI22I_01555 [Saccharothrix sp. ALI-22-I]|nr:hypothetical protein ALI22I_01555 [Saccharothrix sp. ALI-22-I]
MHRASRASWVRATPGDGVLHVAGTAGIVGHRSVHPGDVARQCDTALDDIATLLGPANTVRYGLTTPLHPIHLRSIKVYVRHAHDLPAVRTRCATAFSPQADVVSVVSDICRRELLVEIEGIVPVPAP